MTPEQDIIADLLAQVRALRASLPETLEMIDTPARDVATFAAMPTSVRIGVTAMLKQFEQLEGSLSSLFRAILTAMGQRIKGLYPLDIGNRMVVLDVLDDADAWLAVVKLRNALVHEYVLSTERQFERVTQALQALPMLLDAALRVERLIESQTLLKGRL